MDKIYPNYIYIVSIIIITNQNKDRVIVKVERCRKITLEY